MNVEEVTSIILAFEGIEESPHFDSRSFRVKKKIALTINETKKTFTVKLTPEEQSAFMAFDPSIIFPASGKWGQSGYTIVDMEKVLPEVATDAIRCSYCNVAPGKWANLYRLNQE